MVHANEKDSFEDDPTDAAKAKLKQSGKTLVKTEEREEGSVEGSAYMDVCTMPKLEAYGRHFCRSSFRRLAVLVKLGPVFRWHTLGRTIARGFQ